MKKQNEFCCNSLKLHSTLNCDLHKSIYDCPDVLISTGKNGKDFKIIIHDGGMSGIVIKYCPWCGVKLKQ